MMKVSSCLDSVSSDFFSIFFTKTLLKYFPRIWAAPWSVFDYSPVFSPLFMVSCGLDVQYVWGGQKLGDRTARVPPHSKRPLGDSCPFCSICNSSSLPARLLIDWKSAYPLDAINFSHITFSLRLTYHATICSTGMLWPHVVCYSVLVRRFM